MLWTSRRPILTEGAAQLRHHATETLGIRQVIGNRMVNPRSRDQTASGQVARCHFPPGGGHVTPCREPNAETIFHANVLRTMEANHAFAIPMGA